MGTNENADNSEHENGNHPYIADYLYKSDRSDSPNSAERKANPKASRKQIAKQADATVRQRADEKYQISKRVDLILSQRTLEKTMDKMKK